MPDPRPVVPAVPDAITQADLAEALDSGQFGLSSSFVGGREMAVNVFAWLAARKAPESTERPAVVPVAGDPGEDVATADAQPHDRAEASEPRPVAAAFDRAAVREIARMAIGRYWNHDPLGCDDHPAAERVTLAIWPLLEHAQQALSSNEGVRLWMLDCGELVTRHRERAVAAEAKLAALRSVLLEGGQDAGTARRRAIAIITGSEEGTDRG